MAAKGEALDTEYENVVADVLAFLAGDGATVERNVKLWGRRSKTKRQVDVVVRRKTFGAETTLIVDCKRWQKPLDVADVGSFLGLVEDVGADQGLLVCTEGASAAAIKYARDARGVRLVVMSLQELERWSPPGTMSTEYRIPADKQAAASHKLRRAGFRVRLSDACEPTDDEVTIQVSRHYGTNRPGPDLQTRQWELAESAMLKAGVTEPVHVSHGIIIRGGTPAHRYLEVTIDGHQIGLRFSAATKYEAEQQLEGVCKLLAKQSPSVAPERVSYVTPSDWPVQGLFGGWPE